MKNTNQQRSARTGFSLVELLVVIGIIAILVTVLVSAMGGAGTSARIAATQVTLRQVDDIIQQRYEAVLKADVSSEANRLASLNSISKEEAEFIIRKILYRQALPQRDEDLYGLNLALNGAGSDDAPYAGQYQTAGGVLGGTQSSQTSGELFLYALSEGTAAQVIPGGKLYRLPTLDVGSLNNNHVAVDTATKMRRLVDDWGNTIRFYNFPTRLVQNSANVETLINGIPTGSINQDPLDSLGFLSDPFIMADSSFFYASGMSLNRAAFNIANYHDMNTHYVPLLVSAGPDGAIGLGEPTAGVPNRLGAVVTADDIFDNVTNRQR